VRRRTASIPVGGGLAWGMRVSTEESGAVEQVVDLLGRWRSDAAATVELLESYRQQVEEQRGLLENPKAVSEYLTFFVEFIGRTAAECAQISVELPGGMGPAHVESLRRMAAAAAAEERRCVQFRDKCINKPLPYERMRPLLNDISITTRDQLTAYRDFSTAADRLAALLATQPPLPESKRGMDRRELFTRFFKP
jgi:hypothetical protein